MPTTLPSALADYLAAKQNRDGDALIATLADDAVITDEGREYHGKDEIRAWHEKASVAVNATYEIGEAATVGKRTIVEVGVAGDFPGSPVTLYFHVAFRDEKIAALTVVP